MIYLSSQTNLIPYSYYYCTRIRLYCVMYIYIYISHCLRAPRRRLYNVIRHCFTRVLFAWQTFFPFGKRLNEQSRVSPEEYTYIYIYIWIQKSLFTVFWRAAVKLPQRFLAGRGVISLSEHSSWAANRAPQPR